MGTENTEIYAPAAHYDRVHRAWQLIMGEEFHYGFFRSTATLPGRGHSRADAIDARSGRHPARVSGSSTSDAGRAARPATSSPLQGHRYWASRRARAGWRQRRHSLPTRSARRTIRTARRHRQRARGRDVRCRVGPRVVASHARQAGAAARVRARARSGRPTCAVRHHAQARHPVLRGRGPGARTLRCSGEPSVMPTWNRSTTTPRPWPTLGMTITRRHGHQPADPADVRGLAGERRHPRGPPAHSDRRGRAWTISWSRRTSSRGSGRTRPSATGSLPPSRVAEGRDATPTFDQSTQEGEHMEVRQDQAHAVITAFLGRTDKGAAGMDRRHGTLGRRARPRLPRSGGALGHARGRVRLRPLLGGR